MCVCVCVQSKRERSRGTRPVDPRDSAFSASSMYLRYGGWEITVRVRVRVRDGSRVYLRHCVWGIRVRVRVRLRLRVRSEGVGYLRVWWVGGLWIRVSV